MKLDAFLHFITGHTEQIIGSLFAGILLIGVILLIRSIRQGGEAESSGVALDQKQLEGTLRKVLSATPAAAAPAGDAAMSPEAKAAAEAEIQQLSAAVAEREQKIADLQQTLETAKADLSKGVAGKVDTGELDALRAKIADLEGRLAEYEIIEDDIADLSMYKEENAKLKAQLEAAKAGGAVIPEAAPEPPPAVEPEPEPVVEAAPEVLASEPIIDAAVEPEPEPAEDMGSADDVMKEFAAAVENQKVSKVQKANQISAAELEAELDAATAAKFGDKPAAPSEEPANAPAAQPTMAAPDAKLRDGEVRVAKDAVVEDPSELDSFLADAPDTAAVSEAAVDSEAAAEVVADTDSGDVASEAAFEDPLAGEVDTTKMISEVETLESSTEEAEGDPLADLLDTDKLMAEMSSMDEGKSDDDLLGEFKETKKGS